MPSALRALPRIKTFNFSLSFGACGGEYQSVIITPPNGSADAIGKEETTSNDALQRNALTPIPLPPSEEGGPVSLNHIPLSSPVPNMVSLLSRSTGICWSPSVIRLGTSPPQLTNNKITKKTEYLFNLFPTLKNNIFKTHFCPTHIYHSFAKTPY